MRLIIITQIVDPNDERRGFFVKWIEELAKSYDEVKVITFKSRDYKPPLNVKVCHLGDHFKGWNLLRALKNRVQKDDHVLAHMSPIYAILAWPFVLLRRGKIGLWYAHRSFTFKLWLAHKLCSFIFTATPESTQLKGAKVKSIGHAIDLDQFHEKRKNKGLSTLKLLTVGRITPIKEYEIMINALAEIEGVELRIVGGVAKKEDEAYLRQLRKMIEAETIFLQKARGIGDRDAEKNALSALGLAYSRLGQTRKAIQFFQEQLKISKELLSIFLNVGLVF